MGEEWRTGIPVDDDILRFHRGDEKLFRELVDLYSPKLLTVVRSFIRHPSDPQDLLQETWRQICAKRSSYTGTGPLLHWCYAVCRNVCLAAARRRGVPETETVLDRDLDNVHASDWPGPYARAESEALRREVTRAMRGLPPREKAVLVLRLIRQRSTRETAETLECSDGTVKAALHHAVRKLQVAMKPWRT